MIRIRSIYVRLVVISLIVVWASLALSSYITSRAFRHNMEGVMESRMRSYAETLAVLLEDIPADKLEERLSLLIQLNGLHDYELYGADGQLVSAPREDKRVIESNEIVGRVIHGESFGGKMKGNSDRQRPIPFHGQPVLAGGEPYALFLFPNLTRPNRDFEFGRNRTLLNVLVIGSILLVVVSRYLVRPVNQITEATRRIAKGDFDVKLNIRQQDELGILAASITYMAGELKKMEAMRQEFVSNVSHDIQTPLTSIRGFSKLLQHEDLSREEQLSYLKVIEHEAERLSRLSENLLKLASLQSENYPFHPKSIKLDEQLRRVVVACEPLWSAKSLELDLELPKTVITADSDSLNQMWTNLLHNSIKFTPEGGRISIRLSKEGEFVAVTIADTGIGIVKEDQPLLFQRFFKADSSRSAQGGSGLGLAIVKKMVELHQGEIEVDSTPGAGTAVTVTLPIRLP